jgi:geranylgeranyl reductase family protein
MTGGRTRVRGGDAEAIVVGGGPAGSTLAGLLAERGHRVLLLDKAAFPRHKACSDYINPEGTRLLDALGLAGEMAALGAHTVGAMKVFAPAGAAFLADFHATEAGRRATGLTRRNLDALLLAKAKASGVEVRERAHVRDVLVERGRVVGVAATVDGTRQALRAPLVVGADGRASVVSRSLGLDVENRLLRRTGLVAHYRGTSGLEAWGEMHVHAHGYAGLAPLEDGLTNVAFVSDATAVSARPGSLERYFEGGLARMPEVAERLAGAERVGPLRGVGPMAHHTRRAAGHGYLLVGDAAGFLDPFTGEGVYEALRGALLAAPVASAALRAGDVSAAALVPYQMARRRAFWAKRQVSWLVQGFILSPALLDYAAPRLATRPEVARTLAGVLGNFRPAQQALSPLFLARLLRP